MSDTRKPLWSDSEESENDDSRQKEKRPKSQRDSIEIDVDSSNDDNERPRVVSFDTKWDHFPTSAEFKSIYGESIWEQMSESYDELSKSLQNLSKEFKMKKPDKPEESQDKRITCWESYKQSLIENSQPKARGPGRPPGRPRTTNDANESPKERRRYTKSGDKPTSSSDNNENPNYKPRIQRADAKNKGNRILQCLHCEKKFENKGQARPHLEVHSGIKPYSCSQCDYTSYSKHNVTDAHFSKRHGRKGTRDDVITNHDDKNRLKTLVMRESEKMIERQDMIEQFNDTERNEVSEEEEEEEEGESYTSPYFQSKFNDISNVTKEQTVDDEGVEKEKKESGNGEKLSSISDPNNNIPV